MVAYLGSSNSDKSCNNTSHPVHFQWFEYIFQLKPNNIVYIAFDGVAPVAKLEQQRSRRYKSLYQNNISKSIFKDTKPDPWNTTAITPGTVFMSKLNETIRKNYNDTKKFNINS